MSGGDDLQTHVSSDLVGAVIGIGGRGPNAMAAAVCQADSLIHQLSRNNPLFVVEVERSSQSDDLVENRERNCVRRDLSMRVVAMSNGAPRRPVLHIGHIASLE